MVLQGTQRHVRWVHQNLPAGRMMGQVGRVRPSEGILDPKEPSPETEQPNCRARGALTTQSGVLCPSCWGRVAVMVTLRLPVMHVSHVNTHRRISQGRFSLRWVRAKPRRETELTSSPAWWQRLGRPRQCRAALSAAQEAFLGFYVCLDGIQLLREEHGGITKGSIVPKVHLLSYRFQVWWALPARSQETGFLSKHHHHGVAVHLRQGPWFPHP